jgi:SAM-dependent methyltransferase
MIHTAYGVDSDHEAVPRLDRVQHRVMLDGRAQGPTATTIERAEDRGVVCLCATTGEDHLTGLAAQYIGHIVASFVDRLADLSGKSMRTGWVGEQIAEKRQHRRDGVGTHRCRRRMVEVGVAVVHGNQAMPTYWPTTAVMVEDEAMDGYTDSTYGDAFADVYDDWYADVSDVAATVSFIGELVGQNTQLPVLELGVGTGRLAIPLAAAGLHVVGVDVSATMLAKLTENDPSGLVTPHLGDMVEGLPDGPFAIVFVAFNTLFNLRDASRQAACFAAVAEHLTPGGAFVVEAFVPETGAGSSVAVRSITADSVVLSVATHDDATQTAQGQYISFSESAGVRLRPWAIRYATVAQLDDMATAAGFRVDERWEDSKRTPFGVESSTHITVYRTIHSSVRPEGSTTS